MSLCLSSFVDCSYEYLFYHVFKCVSHVFMTDGLDLTSNEDSFSFLKHVEVVSYWLKNLIHSFGLSGFKSFTGKVRRWRVGKTRYIRVTSCNMLFVLDIMN